MHQTSLTALTEFGGPAVSSAQPLIDRVRQLSDHSSPQVQTSARQFLKRYSK
jgi:hypothetical protein